MECDRNRDEEIDSICEQCEKILAVDENEHARIAKLQSLFRGHRSAININASSTKQFLSSSVFVIPFQSNAVAYPTDLFDCALNDHAE
eukprot:873499-Rhodomonas_salina.5